MIIVIFLVFRSIGKKKKFIKKAKKNGWYVEGVACDRKYGHYSQSARQEVYTCDVTFKYEINGKEYFVKKKYYNRSGANVNTPSKATVYYKPSNPKKAYV
jgi:hypothetical protein